MVDLSRRKNPLKTRDEDRTGKSNWSHVLFALDADHSNQFVLYTS